MWLGAAVAGKERSCFLSFRGSSGHSGQLQPGSHRGDRAWQARRRAGWGRPRTQLLRTQLEQ